ncbi:MAG: hypothetical protein AAF612_12740 [Planctomycetota bacterium]
MPKREIPPYEIMRRAERRPDDAEQARAPRHEPETDADPSADPGVHQRIEAATQWALEPVGPSLPRLGWAGVAVAGVVLLAIAFAIGRASAPNEIDPNPQDQVVAPPPGLERPPAAGPADPSPSTAEPATRLIPGQNYLRLPEVPPDEAERLREFAAGRSVRIEFAAGRRIDLLVPYLVDHPLERPAGADQARANQIKQGVLQLGREWKRFNGGRGDDLSSSYWSRYDGP